MTTSSNPTTSSPSRPNPSQPSSPHLSSNHEKSHVIDILPTATAQTYSHLHPFLLLALYAFRFQSLVADPVSTLWSDLPIYTVLQITYAVTCLPQAGSSHQHHAGSSRNDTNAVGEISESSKRHVSASASTLASAAKRKRTHKSDSFSQKVTAAFISLTLTSLLGTPVFALLLILFGAPFTTHTAHTFLCAAHMALLTATPLIYVHGVNGTIWRQICAFTCSADILWGGAMGTCVGAWVGAVPIPLDWDRPWQAYPITILTGAYLGFALGQFLARTPLLYGKRINF